MGFNFRKSIKVGPARINLSKSGVGYSIGAGGLRYTKSPKRKSSNKKNTPQKMATVKRTAPTIAATVAHNGAQPHKRSWALVITISLIGIVVVGGGSFIATFICYAIASLFAPGILGSLGSKFFVFGIPALLAIGSVLIAYFRWHPLPEVSAENETCHDPSVLDAPPQKSAYQERKDSAISQFEAELSAIPQSEVKPSAPAQQQLLKNLPDYSFSNITRKTRLDSIFPLVFLDVETTDLYPTKGEIVEVAAIKFDTGMIPVESFATLCKPKASIPDTITEINGITDSMVADAPTFAEIAPALTDFLAGCHVAGHNLDFDLRFIFAHGAKLPENTRYYDTLDLAHLTVPSAYISNYKLDTLCNYYQIWRGTSHRALSDCFAASKLFTHLILDKTDRQLAADPGGVPESDT